MTEGFNYQLNSVYNSKIKYLNSYSNKDKIEIEPKYLNKNKYNPDLYNFKIIKNYQNIDNLYKFLNNNFY